MLTDEQEVTTIRMATLADAVRKKRGDLSQVDAAQAAGVPRATLSRLERGTHRPSYDTAVKLARWLGWTVEEVMAGAVVSSG